MSAKQVEERDPVRVEAWHRCEEEFIAEASTLGDIHLDPWGRPLPKMIAEYDSGHEDIICWNGVTTVRGKTVRLSLLND